MKFLLRGGNGPPSKRNMWLWSMSRECPGSCKGPRQRMRVLREYAGPRFVANPSGQGGSGGRRADLQPYLCL